MDLSIFKKLREEGLISADSLQRVALAEEKRFFSLHWELKTLLYLGVTLLSTGLGILVYKNIDSIGHTAVLLFIAAVSAGCWWYCLQKRAPFSVGKVPAPNSFFDYILLLGCLTFITFIGYIQYQYSFFGTAYGLATFIPMVVLFAGAYFFDHLGVLSLAITNLTAWVGITLTPLRIWQENDFDNMRLVWTGIALGVLLLVLGVLSEKRDYKRHFEFTYSNFGTHLLFVSGLAGLFILDNLYLGWFLLLVAAAWYCYREAIKRKSFYFVLILTLYMYIALSTVVLRLLWALTRHSDTIGAVYLAFIYFILSAIALIRILMTQNHKLKTRDSL